MTLFRKIAGIFSVWGFDWFVPALFFMILLGWMFPQFGTAQGLFSLKSLAGYGISVIFFLYGLRLSIKQLLGCLSNWKLHLIIQSTTFIAFPLIAFAIRPFFSNGPYEVIWFGVLFLAALPSTVSSAVVMVSLAGGNVPAAIFNASFSSIAGIFIAPLWMGLALTAGAGGFEMSPVLIKLGYQVLLPLLTGIFLHRWLGGFAIRARGYTRYFDQSVILAIVYSSFAGSFSNGLFSNLGIPVILILTLLLFLLFLGINIIILFLIRRTGLSRNELITALFCGSTKSLMHGSVMAKVMFAGSGMGGVILLPILIYHAMQLTITGILSQKFARGAGGETS